MATNFVQKKAISCMLLNEWQYACEQFTSQISHLDEDSSQSEENVHWNLWLDSCHFNHLPDLHY